MRFGPKNRSFPLLAASLFCALAGAAHAGGLDDAKARRHLEAVAASDLDALMRDYAEDAWMDWVGGPLDGRYHGRAQIRAVWEKFIAANNGQPRPASFSKPHSFSNPKGSSIETSAEYGGTAPVKVWHVLTFREGELSTELWQIAPALKVER